MIEDVKAMCLNSQQVLDVAVNAARFSIDEIEAIILYSGLVFIVAFLAGMAFSVIIGRKQHHELFIRTTGTETT